MSVVWVWIRCSVCVEFDFWIFHCFSNCALNFFLCVRFIRTRRVGKIFLLFIFPLDNFHTRSASGLTYSRRVGGEATKLIKDFIFIFTREFGEDLFVCDATVKKQRARQRIKMLMRLWFFGWVGNYSEEDQNCQAHKTFLRMAKFRPSLIGGSTVKMNFLFFFRKIGL